MRSNITDCVNPELVGDGYCHDETNNFQCGFDGGDCCYTCTSKVKCDECKCLTGNDGQYKSDSLIGDGYCNDETNNDQCNFDGYDCCGSCVNQDRCTKCNCYGNWSIDHYSNFPNALVGDGFCNDETNIADCNYDAGDCCGTCINKEKCTYCLCHEEKVTNEIPNARVGDGFCNPETNNENCNFDGGDCCDDRAELKNGTCKIRDSCIDGFASFFVGDGYCNDETNIKECLHDGLDCGQVGRASEVDTTFCALCEEHLAEGMF